MEAPITRGVKPAEILETLRREDGYYLCNNERDVSQSDFKNRLMPMTSVRVAPYREAAGFFSVEVSGGASVHVDLIRRQVNPFERLAHHPQGHAPDPAADGVPGGLALRLPPLSGKRHPPGGPGVCQVRGRLAGL